jgi:hypothetical protein
MNRLRGQYRGARPSSQRNITQQPTQADEPLDYLMEVDPEVEEMELQHGYYFLKSLKSCLKNKLFFEDCPELCSPMWIPQASDLMEWESPDSAINDAHLMIRNLSLVLGYDDCKYKL